jgi:uncharacterized protein YacL
MENVTTAWHSAATAAQQAAHRLEAAGRRLEVSNYLLATVIGIVTGLLVSAFLLWRTPAPIVENVLDAKAVVDLLKAEIALQKPRKGK